MTRTDSFIFAIKKMLEEQREYIDSFEVKNLQINVTFNREGTASGFVMPKVEQTVVGCFEGYARRNGYVFAGSS